MKITIGHLFYDLLNLYGESGNILALIQAFKSQGIEVDIKELSLRNEPWNLNDLDIIYIGAGTEQSQKTALNTLLKYKEQINQMILNNKHIIATGNAIELFGKTIKVKDEEIPALGLFDYTTQRTDKRIVSECVFESDEIDDLILGFENHQGTISGITSPLFTVKKGFSSDLQSKFEGFKHMNFYGTYLIGPLLVRNPKLLEKICKDVILDKDNNFEFIDFNLELEQKAHDEFLKKYKG